MLVSVITVSRNSETTIQKTIESVYVQSYQQLEYIIVDGASTDHTMQIVEDAVECTVCNYSLNSALNYNEEGQTEESWSIR